jgi:hypothetical protein
MTAADSESRIESVLLVWCKWDAAVRSNGEIEEDWCLKHNVVRRAVKHVPDGVGCGDDIEQLHFVLPTFSRHHSPAPKHSLKDREISLILGGLNPRSSCHTSLTPLCSTAFITCPFVSSSKQQQQSHRQTDSNPQS